MQYQLKSRQICFFLIAFVPLTKLFALPSLLAGVANEDMWLCSLLNLILDLFTVGAILYACKKSNCDFFTLLENNFGKPLSKVILGLFFLYFTIKAVIPLNEQKDYVELTLYTLKPNILYFLPFFILPFYLSMKKVRVIGRLADILWFVTLNGLITLFVLSFGNVDIGAILPVGANKFSNIAKGAYFALSRFGDCTYLLFFIGQFSYKNRDAVKILLSYALSGLLIIVFMIIFYCVFTSIAFRQRFALTEISKYSTVINNLGRFDYIGIIMILFSNMFSLALPMYFSSKILNKIFNINNKWIAPIITVSIQLIVIVFLGQFIVSIEYFVINYSGLFLIALGNIFPILFCFLCKKEINHEKS